MLLCEGVHEVDLYYDYDTLENMTLVIGFIMRRIYFFLLRKGKKLIEFGQNAFFLFFVSVIKADSFYST